MYSCSVLPLFVWACSFSSTIVLLSVYKVVHWTSSCESLYLYLDWSSCRTTFCRWSLNLWHMPMVCLISIWLTLILVVTWFVLLYNIRQSGLNYYTAANNWGWEVLKSSTGQPPLEGKAVYYPINSCPAEMGYILFRKQCRSRSAGFIRSQLIMMKPADQDQHCPAVLKGVKGKFVVALQGLRYGVKLRMSFLPLHTNDVLITIMGQNKIWNKIDNPETIIKHWCKKSEWKILTYILLYWNR